MTRVEGVLIPYFGSVEADVDFRDRAFAFDVYTKIGVLLGRLDEIEAPRTRPLQPGERPRVLDGGLLARKEAACKQLAPLRAKAYRRTLAVE